MKKLHITPPTRKQVVDEQILQDMYRRLESIKPKKPKKGR